MWIFNKELADCAFDFVTNAVENAATNGCVGGMSDGRMFTMWVDEGKFVRESMEGAETHVHSRRDVAAEIVSVACDEIIGNGCTEVDDKYGSMFSCEQRCFVVRTDNSGEAVCPQCLWSRIVIVYGQWGAIVKDYRRVDIPIVNMLQHDGREGNRRGYDAGSNVPLRNECSEVSKMMPLYVVGGNRIMLMWTMICPLRLPLVWNFCCGAVGGRFVNRDLCCCVSYVDG